MNKGKDAQAKIEEASARYHSSEKGREAKRRYDTSPKGKDARQKYLQSEKGQMALLRYFLSEKGVMTRQRRNELNRLLTQCGNFLQENPGKTISDFFNSLK